MLPLMGELSAQLTEGEKMLDLLLYFKQNGNFFLSLRPFGAPPSSEGGMGAAVDWAAKFPFVAGQASPDRGGGLGIMHERKDTIFAILPICIWEDLRYNYKAYLCTNL